jgi:segregation and condensation protein A
VNNTSYQIKLPQFEGPFDLLLFFIERDELDIYNIPITNIINEFLVYIHSQDSVNIELSSEFILFISTLMRIKAKMLLPRKEVDAEGLEIDPRQELIDKILEYKRFKEAATKEGFWSQRFTRGKLYHYLPFVKPSNFQFTALDTYDYAMQVRIKK